MSVLVLESGAARHRRRKKIPDNDIVVTNYSLLRRDLEDLQTYKFNAIVLDEAQFIKNPGAQVTQSVKQLKCICQPHRHPLENRLLDLWSIVISCSRAISATRNISMKCTIPVAATAKRPWPIAASRASACPRACAPSCCAA